jgi:hypothetical protein
MTVDKTFNAVEKWRRDKNLTVPDVASKIWSSPALVYRAERGEPIRRKFIDRFVSVSGGVLAVEDFVEASKTKAKRKTNGKARKSRRQGRR